VIGCTDAAKVPAEAALKAADAAVATTLRGMPHTMQVDSSSAMTQPCA